MRDSGQGDVLVTQEINQVIRRRLAFDICGKRENELTKLSRADAVQQLPDPQIFRRDVVERRNPAA